MFSVLFEVRPSADQWDAYLGYARMLRPELERIKGFVHNIRFRSLSREAWILSLSNWDDEKALVRWRTQAKHHGVQEKGREDVLLDHHLRVDQVTRDTSPPAGHALREQRLDETEVGEGTTVILIDARQAKDWVEKHCHEDVARCSDSVPRRRASCPWTCSTPCCRPETSSCSPPGAIRRGPGVRGHDEITGWGPPASRPHRTGLRHVRTSRGAATITDASGR